MKLSMNYVFQLKDTAPASYEREARPPGSSIEVSFNALWKTLPNYDVVEKVNWTEYHSQGEVLGTYKHVMRETGHHSLHLLRR